MYVQKPLPHANFSYNLKKSHMKQDKIILQIKYVKAEKCGCNVENMQNP